MKISTGPSICQIYHRRCVNSILSSMKIKTEKKRENSSFTKSLNLLGWEEDTEIYFRRYIGKYLHLNAERNCRFQKD
jgi:hypothetical protein